MPDAVEVNSILERLDDGLLADNVLENLRPELSGNNLIFHERANWARLRGHCGTSGYLLPLLPSGPGGVCRLQLHSPPNLIIGV